MLVSGFLLADHMSTTTNFLQLQVQSKYCQGRAKMGHLTQLAFLSVVIHGRSLASDLPPVGLIPVELLQLFHPDEVNDLEHPGRVDRQRRATGVDDSEDPTRPTYTLFTQEGAPCILVKTDAIFNLDYRTLRQGVKSVKVVLPDEPGITGSCVRTGITAVLNLHWSAFKFSLVFDENPEGNSYYLNKAVLEYNQTRDIFPDSTYKGHVVLNTKEGGNFYFTPLGKSYVCEVGDDQGPLPLYNQDDEMVGNLTLFNTKFQPFVKRAKGEWGPGEHCLPKSIQVMRENVVPYVSSLVFAVSVVLMVAIYGIIRYFTTKKTAYQFYGDQQPDNEGNLETHEMKTVTNVRHEASFDEVNGSTTTTLIHNPPTQPVNNPFKKDPTNNPFTQNNV